MMQSTLTIVIPTSNRQLYALSAVSSCLALSEKIDVIVCDSSETEELKDLIAKGLSPERVLYLKTSSSYSIVQNFSAALPYVKGRFVTYIGDDDFVSSALLEVCEFCDQHSVDVCTFAFPAAYFWPDYRHRRSGSVDAGTLQIGHYSGRIQHIDATDALRRALRVLGTGPGRMPRIYAGLVSTEYLCRLVAKHETIFGGVSPDVYSSVLLASENPSFLHVDFPAIVPGIGGKSGSGSSSQGSHIGSLKGNRYMQLFGDIQWDPLVPEYYSVPTVWASSTLAALKKLDDQTHPNYVNVYVRCLLYARGYADHVGAAYCVYMRQASFAMFVRDLWATALGEVAYVTKAIYSIVKRRLGWGGTVIRTGVADVAVASRLLEDMQQIELLRARMRTFTRT
jgi:glycosyltransferase involved in cell wall biosynthesis